MMGRYQNNAGIGRGGGRGRIPASREGDRFGKTLALGQNVEHGFVAGGCDPIQLDPALDDDEEGRCGLTLPKQGVAGLEIDDGRLAKKGLHRSRIEAAEHGGL